MPSVCLQYCNISWHTSNTEGNQPVWQSFDTGVTHLSVSVAKCDGDNETLEAVEDDVEVLISGLPLAVRVFLWPVVFQIRLTRMS